MTTEKQTSEFGQGFFYCLALFLEHAGRMELDRRSEKRLEFNIAHLWFNASSDHLYDLIIPPKLSPELSIKVTEFKNKCLEWGHGYSTNSTWKDVEWSIQEAKDIIRLSEKELLKINTIKGRWE